MSEIYVSDYESHLEQFKAHLAGTTDESSPASFIPPAGYWTSREKDCFFHALAIHSRLRPDLIAHSIKSKTVLDVCTYLDALDKAAASQPSPSLRSELEGAMEVSASWVDYEESQASGLSRLELHWEEDEEAHSRATILASRPHDDPTYFTWKVEQESLWQKHDALKKLSPAHFEVMDTLMRTSSDDNDEESLPVPPSSQTSEQGPDNSSTFKPQEEPPTSSPPIVSNESESSPAALTVDLPSSPVPDHTSSPSAAYLKALSPASRRRLKKRLAMRKKRAEVNGTIPNLLPVVLPSRTRTKASVSKSKRRKGKLHLVQELGNEAELESEENIQAAFRERNIDSNALTELGFDIFNFHRLGKLMGWEEHTDFEPDGPASISFETVQILRSILLEFTTRVVQSTISIREQEFNLKRNMAIWRLQKEDEITFLTVNEALKMHWFPSSKYVHHSSADVPYQNMADREGAFHGQLPLHRELVPPVVLHVESDGVSLIPNEENEEELLAKLEDEERALNELDQQLERRYEENLWKGARG
ncbi:hypothetical protein R3P38DRAFT_2839714 [Favolaschia claudopus]|uniref:Uncharacterized protein n=1 Tax=Favolaschia claudopus TaxID=2862362 RepID=A0AAW0E085_9AGAR